MKEFKLWIAIGALVLGTIAFVGIKKSRAKAVPPQEVFEEMNVRDVEEADSEETSEEADSTSGDFEE